MIIHMREAPDIGVYATEEEAHALQDVLMGRKTLRQVVEDEGILKASGQPLCLQFDEPLTQGTYGYTGRSVVQVSQIVGVSYRKWVHKEGMG